MAMIHISILKCGRSAECLAEHCEYGALHDEMIRDRIVVGIVDRLLSLKLQLDAQLTLKKAIDAAHLSNLLTPYMVFQTNRMDPTK